MLKLKRNVLLLLLSGVVFTQPAFALFDDKEARERIIEVEEKMINNNQTLSKDIDAIRLQLEELESVVKGQGLADLLNQIDRLNRENAQLKGEVELLSHQLKQMEQREKDLYVDTDTRIRTIEENIANQKTQVTSGAQFSNSAQETEQDQQLAQANILLEEGAYQLGFESFDQFIKAYPDYSRVDEAKYGLGYAQYSLKNYKSAIDTLKKMVDAHPNSIKAPDALVIIGNAQIQLGRVQSAKQTFKRIKKDYPDSTVIPIAEKRLKVLSAF